MVLFSGSAAYTDGAYYLPVFFQRNPSGENHDLSVVGSMEPKKLTSGLRMLRQIFSRDIKGTGGISFFNRDVNAAYPSPVHSHMGDKVSAGVRHRNVHRLADFFRFLFCCSNNLLCLF